MGAAVFLGVVGVALSWIVISAFKESPNTEDMGGVAVTGLVGLLCVAASAGLIADELYNPTCACDDNIPASDH